MRVEGRTGEALPLLVDHQVDVILRPDRHALRAMTPLLPKAKGPDRVGQPLSRRIVDGEFDEFHAFGAGARGQSPDASVGQLDQRATAIDRDDVRGGGAEQVVEDLQAQVAVVAGRPHGIREALDVEVALAGHVAVMAAPRQQIHLQPGRVGELDEEDAIARDRPDAVRVEAARKRVKAVEDQADAGVVGAAHDLPGIAVIADMASPGQRLVSHPDSPLRGPDPKFVEVGCTAVDAAERMRRDGGADQHEVRPEVCHDVELAHGAVESLGAERLGQSLEITERLKQADRHAAVAHHLAHVARRMVEGHEILLEDLDAVEAGTGDRGDLVGQVAAERHGRDRRLHGWPPVSGPRRSGSCDARVVRHAPHREAGGSALSMIQDPASSAARQLSPEKSEGSAA